MPSADWHLYALGAGTGNVKWNFKAGAEPGTPVVMGNTVLLGGWIDDHIYAVDVEKGVVLWKFRTDVYRDKPGSLRGSPILEGNQKAYVQGGAFGRSPQYQEGVPCRQIGSSFSQAA